jgi:hypothetical protein
MGSGVELQSAGRVVCSKEGVLFVAGVVAVPELPKGAAPVFDQFTNAAKNDPTAEGKPTVTLIDGRRAFLNRQVVTDGIAETGLVEIDRARVVFGVVGGKLGSGLSLDEQTAMIDRFYRSIRVAK